MSLPSPVTIFETPVNPEISGATAAKLIDTDVKSTITSEVTVDALIQSTPKVSTTIGSRGS